MSEPRGATQTLSDLDELLKNYRKLVGEHGFDQTRLDDAVEAVHALGHDRADARRWLATKAGKR